MTCQTNAQLETLLQFKYFVWTRKQFSTSNCVVRELGLVVQFEKQRWENINFRVLIFVIALVFFPLGNTILDQNHWELHPYLRHCVSGHLLSAPGCVWSFVGLRQLMDGQKVTTRENNSGCIWCGSTQFSLNHSTIVWPFLGSEQNAVHSVSLRAASFSLVFTWSYLCLEKQRTDMLHSLHFDFH